MTRSQFMIARHLAQAAVRRRPGLVTGMANASASTYAPTDVQFGMRAAPMGGTGVAFGLSPGPLNFGIPTLAIDGRTPMVLGVSPWQTTSAS